jgi:excisionase family DNA binding protein
MINEDDHLLTIAEVAQWTGLAVGTLYHLVSEGRIPVIRISKRCIRFSRCALNEWIKQCSEEPSDRKNNIPRSSNRF